MKHGIRRGRLTPKIMTFHRRLNSVCAPVRRPPPHVKLSRGNSAEGTHPLACPFRWRSVTRALQFPNYLRIIPVVHLMQRGQPLFESACAPGLGQRRTLLCAATRVFRQGILGPTRVFVLYTVYWHLKKNHHDALQLSTCHQCNGDVGAGAFNHGHDPHCHPHPASGTD